MENRLNGLNPLAYMGVAPVSVASLLYKTSDPTATDAKNFAIGAVWINTSSLIAWILMSLSSGVATWVPFAGGPSPATSFPTDSGTATPLAGVLNVFGTANQVATSGSGNTVTIALTNTVIIPGDFHARIINADGNAATNGQVNITSRTADSVSGIIQFFKNRSNGIITSGDSLGRIIFNGFDGTQNLGVAEIRSTSSGTISANRIASDLSFYTHPDSTSGPFIGLNINPNGAITEPLQPSFLVYLSTNVPNVTGDGTLYTVVWDLESFDRANNFATGTFTAPVTGIYRFDVNLLITGLAAGNTNGQIQIRTTQTTFVSQIASYGAVMNVANQFGAGFTVLAPMTATDTAVVAVLVDGGAKVVGLTTGAPTNPLCWFSGNLVA